MISLSCDHPDLEDFIRIKSDLDKINKANISIRFTNKFMEAVENNELFTLSFTRKETNETIEKKVNARDVLMLLAEMNYDYAEPGAIFWDNIVGAGLLEKDATFEYAGLNPCAEEPLPAGGSCLLGSINLSEFVTENKEFDFEEFKKVVKEAVFALNEVLDEGLFLHPLAEQRRSAKDWRQIGLGIMGLADMLIKMEINYGSKESIELCDSIGDSLASIALDASCNLSRKTLDPYRNFRYNPISYSRFYINHFHADLDKKIKNYGLRNSQLLTIAPTGTISTMLGISGGIEPIFANSYSRKTESLHGHDEVYKIFTPIAQKYMKEHNLTEESELPDYFITAKNINYVDRINMQSIWQKHIDASISSTINLPNEATVETIFDLYVYAWKKGLKGVTVFREGCKRAGILDSNIKSDPKEENNEIKFDSIVPITRKELGLEPLPSSSYYKQVACGNMYIHITHDNNNNIVEVFVDPGKSGICAANAQNIGRQASAALRAGMKVESVIDSMLGVKCSACTKLSSRGEKLSGLSCGDTIARAIQEEYNRINNKNNEKLSPPTISKDLCPECGHEIAHEGGCKVCKNCGWSKCS